MFTACFFSLPFHSGVTSHTCGYACVPCVHVELLPSDADQETSAVIDELS